MTSIPTSSSDGWLREFNTAPHPSSPPPHNRAVPTPTPASNLRQFQTPTPNSSTGTTGPSAQQQSRRRGESSGMVRVWIPWLRVLRVNQLDADRLNSETTDILRSQFLRIFRFFEPKIIDRLQPELTALLEFLIYRFSVFESNQSLGDKLQNLRYVNATAPPSALSSSSSSSSFAPSSSTHRSASLLRLPFSLFRNGVLLSLFTRNTWEFFTDGLLWNSFLLVLLGSRLISSLFKSKSDLPAAAAAVSAPLASAFGAPPSTLQRVFHGILSIGGRWAWARLTRLVIDRGWGDQPDDSWRYTVYRWLSHIEVIYQLVHILNFLVFLNDGKYRSIVDRLLGMRLVFARPLIVRQVSFEFMNRQLVWNGFAELLFFLIPLINLERLKRGLINLIGGGQPPLVDEDEVPLSACPICFSDPIPVPYINECGHLYCYYCLKAALVNDPGLCCARCGQKIQNIHRFDMQHTGNVAVPNSDQNDSQ